MGVAEVRRSGAALLVGVGEYLHADRIQPLRFAVPDALALGALLVDSELCGFPADSVRVLTDAEASRDALVHHLSKWLPGQSRGADVALIYFAGHGAVERIGQREEGFLLPHDGDPDDLVTRGVAMGDLARWIEGIEASAVVVCFDCCHAGRVVSGRIAPRSITSRDMKIKPGHLHGLAGRRRYLIASCDEGQVSIEAERLGHGLFTYHLLEGLRGAGDRDGDGRVGVSELFEYVAESVERDARELGMEQRPWSSSIGVGGVYLASPLKGPLRDTERGGDAGSIAEIERAWREEGAARAVTLMEAHLDGASESHLVAVLRLLASRQAIEGIPIAFRCLTHSAERVRERARQAIHAVGWERAAFGVDALARGGDPDAVGSVLDGLAAFESHPEVVAMLDRLVNLLKCDLRNRAILLLERKRQGLELERVAALFKESNAACRIEKALGQGLFTAAYLARDESTEIDLVIRVLRPEFAARPRVRAQFLDLSRKAARLVHANLVMTREVRVLAEHQIYYAARDYVEGPTLQRLLESGKVFDRHQIIDILRQLIDALAHIHAEGLIHGGVKPSNVFLSGRDRVILGDLAVPIQDLNVVLDRTAYDFRYAAPEMFRQGAPLGPPADFYALGCLAYELACGTPPFVSDNPYELAILHDRERAEPASRRRSRLEAPGDVFLASLLAKQPEQRPADAEAVRAALDQLRLDLDAGAQAKPPPPLLRDQSMIRYRSDAASIVAFDPEDERFEGSVASFELAPPPVVEPEPAPEMFGRYDIIRMLGQGGMGKVYLARDRALAREVALKINDGGLRTPGAEARFRREARAAARIAHPNIISIYDVGVQDGRAYAVLEYVDGGNLGEMLRERGRFQPDEAARLIITLARAVQTAHDQGVLHRDLKPSNIMLTREGTPKISDFGLAKLSEDEPDEDRSAQTMVGQIMGTPSYMSPEQAVGGEIDARSDVYSLGTMLYELIAGRRPFVADSMFRVLAMLATSPPPPLREFVPDAPEELERIALRCLEKKPELRYQSAADLASDLERWISAPADRSSASSRTTPRPSAFSVAPRAKAAPRSLGEPPPARSPSRGGLLGWLLRFFGGGGSSE